MGRFCQIAVGVGVKIMVAIGVRVGRNWIRNDELVVETGRGIWMGKNKRKKNKVKTKELC